MDQESIEESFHIVLCYFDEVIGPELVTVSPKFTNPLSEKILGLLPSLMDIQDEILLREPFIFSNPYFMSYNLIFRVPRSSARGGTDDYMVSIVLTPSDARGLIVLSGLRDLLPTLRDGIVKLLYESQERDVREEVEKVFEGFIEPLGLFIETQNEIWGKGSFRIGDFFS
ncbi:MAG: hypothetical protein D6732_09620 [Methanobacteriota archaeon]|nr:MAG: hypothetical protein D6732_09620 [Euryarchaeota archaeon]